MNGPGIELAENPASRVFGADYAGVYDALYRDKDYASECRVLEHVFAAFGRHPIRRVLDLGCGTGNHAIPLATSGYDVIGVDRSPEMLALAREKAARQGVDARASFHLGDIGTLKLPCTADAALMMFAVLGYQTSNDDALAALRAVRRQLNPGSVFVFDVWYGPAVLAQRPEARLRETHTLDGRILRHSSGELNLRQQVCTVRFHVQRFHGEHVAAEVRESHRVRFFFPLELDLLLRDTGFELVRLGAFPDFDRDPDETTWSVLGIARAR